MFMLEVSPIWRMAPSPYFFLISASASLMGSCFGTDVAVFAVEEVDFVGTAFAAMVFAASIIEVEEEVFGILEVGNGRGKEASKRLGNLMRCTKVH